MVAPEQVAAGAAEDAGETTVITGHPADPEGESESAEATEVTA